MKKSILSLIFAFFTFCLNAQSVICIQHGGTTFFESRLDSAVAHAQNGDVIYLPGGVIGSSAILNINKKLTMIGAGYHPDSSKATGATYCLFAFNFITGSDSSLLTGIYTNTEITINVSNITITRCNIDKIKILSNGLSNINLSENIITKLYTNSNGYNLPNMIVSKNIFYDVISDIWMVEFKNNIFLCTTCSFTWFMNNIKGVFQNNIFIHNTTNFDINAGANKIYVNNLFIADSTVINNNGSNNYFNESLTNIFTNYSSGSTWNSYQNFHLKSTSHGKNLGTDGTDVGIYGTTTPFKEGGIPFNPHFQVVSIPNTTGVNGTLNINITVKAQNQ